MPPEMTNKTNMPPCILSSLDFPSGLNAISLTCHAWNKETRHDARWKKLVSLHFPTHILHILETDKVDWKSLLIELTQQQYATLSSFATNLMIATKLLKLDTVARLIDERPDYAWLSIQRQDGTTLLDTACRTQDQALLNLIYATVIKKAKSLGHTTIKLSPKDGTSSELSHLNWAAICNQTETFNAFLASVTPLEYTFQDILLTLSLAYQYQHQDILDCLFNLLRSSKEVFPINDLATTLKSPEYPQHHTTTLRLFVLCKKTYTIQLLLVKNQMETLYEFICPIFKDAQPLFDCASQAMRDLIFHTLESMKNTKGLVTLRYSKHQPIKLSIFEAAILLRQKDYLLKHADTHLNELSNAKPLLSKYQANQAELLPMIDAILQAKNSAPTSMCLVQ